VWGKFHPEILRGSPSGGVKQGMGGFNQQFSIFKRECLANGTVADTAKVTTNRTPSGMGKW